MIVVMQVIETLSEGLKREFKVVVPLADLEAKANDRLGELKGRVHINGFRQGKVAVSHLKRMYGRGAMAEAVEGAVGETNAKIGTDNGFKLARDPQAMMPTEGGGVRKRSDGNSRRALQGGSDADVKTVEPPGAVMIDEAFAKSLGLDSLAKFNSMIKDRIGQEHALITRQRLKRVLLDKLDELHKFGLPPTMIEDEFNNVWKAVSDELQSQKRTFADEYTTEEKAKAEYRAIAERRVRLGLVLAEIGERNNIKVSDEELTRAVVEQSR